MPLLDHFHPPLSQRRHWESFHSAWATALVDSLNKTSLPRGYFAEEMITLGGGGRVEIDVATFEEPIASQFEETGSNGNAVAVAPAKKVWTPPAPTVTMPYVFPDSFSVQVYGSEGGPTLVGAVELISPGNKDRDEYRQAFAIKCANYLHQQIGLVIVDIVTSRSGNMHNELIDLLGQPADYRMADDLSLYCVAYRPGTRGGKPQVDMWQQPLALGQPLPILPLALKRAWVVELDLNTPYEDVCQRRQLS
jgi:hypothetical protein